MTREYVGRRRLIREWRARPVDPDPASRPLEAWDIAYFWTRVQKTSEGCWIWTGELVGRNRYGLVPDHRYPPLANGGVRRQMAHRFAYLLLVGGIPDGLTLDHLCHTSDPTCLVVKDCLHRACVNPAHLEPVTTAENSLRGHGSRPAINARKTHCIRGHSLAEAHLNPKGERICRPCSRAKWTRWYLNGGKERRRRAA